jgi:hypothetical protein
MVFSPCSVAKSGKRSTSMYDILPVTGSESDCGRQRPAIRRLGVSIRLEVNKSSKKAVSEEFTRHSKILKSTFKRRG